MCIRDRPWRAAFAAAEAGAETVAKTLLVASEDGSRQPQIFEGALIPALLDALPAGQQVFCGNSLAIRDLDSFSGASDKPLRFFANRGASGIDGNLSTALGIARSTGSCVALLGDLSAQHDLMALAAAASLESGQLVVVVLNNGGGGIFDYLSVASLPEFERGWLTPQGVDLVAAAQSLGVVGERVASLSAFTASLEQALRRGGVTLLEVSVDRQASVAGRRDFWQRVSGSIA